VTGARDALGFVVVFTRGDPVSFAVINQGELNSSRTSIGGIVCGNAVKKCMSEHPRS
jgi:hypothetical protein